MIFTKLREAITVAMRKDRDLSICRFRIHGVSSDGLHLPCHRTTDDRVFSTPCSAKWQSPFQCAR
ncbi:hypothetical protein ANN_17965 [Periplaneta americana]|uniref:Uncharacterized protein n=1 Tax=Periplaneta americana TaxID=6978 RepID=A0ABQ8SNW9_PERAM|nr:hypothetical protein ANN_17965 [Periplaneta americana]